MSKIVLNYFSRIYKKSVILIWPTVLFLLILMPFGIPIMMIIVYIKKREKDVHK
jgi:hypothetical protein